MSSDGKARGDAAGRIHYYKTYAMAMLIGSLGLASIIAYVTIDNFSRPLVSTCHYHFNVQYRAGNEQAMFEVVNNSLYPLLQMYSRHPTWKANIEFQGLLLEVMNATLPACMTMLRLLVRRDQIQLIVVQYSDALAIAYPYIDFYKSILYARQLLQDLDLVNATDTDGVSRAVLLQEGQFMLGTSRLVHDFRYSGSGSPVYDTFLTTRESLSYFGVRSNAPIYTYSIGGEQMYVLPYWIPSVEAGVMHHVLWFQDGENLNSGEGQTWEAGGLENLTGQYFPFNPQRQANHEEQLMDLERQGNRFMTLDEWVAFLLERSEAFPLGRYVPETHWAVFRYRSSFIWMGETAGGSYYDDSEINANNYKTHQILLATEALLDYGRAVNPANITGPFLVNLRSILDRAWLDLAEAEVTDSTGLQPREFEGQQAINHTRFAVANATWVQASIINATTALQNIVFVSGNPIQIGALANGTVMYMALSTAGFTNFTAIGAATYADLAPVTIDTRNNGSIQLTRGKVESSNYSALNGQEYISIKVPFPRTNGTSLSEKWSYIAFNGDFSSIQYSPSLWENLTVTLNRTDYNPDNIDEFGDWDSRMDIDNFQIYLPLANGLLYSANGGYAIVKNCSSSHVTMRWKADKVRFLQTETRSALNPAGETWEYFLLKNVTVATALGFANLVNTNVPYTIKEADLP
nr:hypothetical protein [Candidatus Sigynarchaeota archaeon]